MGVHGEAVLSFMPFPTVSQVVDLPSCISKLTVCGPHSWKTSP